MCVCVCMYICIYHPSPGLYVRVCVCVFTFQPNPSNVHSIDVSFDAVGAFREEKCEDLLFLLAHVRRGGALHRVTGDPLVNYR